MVPVWAFPGQLLHVRATEGSAETSPPPVNLPGCLAFLSPGGSHGTLCSHGRDGPATSQGPHPFPWAPLLVYHPHSCMSSLRPRPVWPVYRHSPMAPAHLPQGACQIMGWRNDLGCYHKMRTLGGSESPGHLSDTSFLAPAHPPGCRISVGVPGSLRVHTQVILAQI